MTTPQNDSELQLESARVHLSNMVHELDHWLSEWKTQGRPSRVLVESLLIDARAAYDKLNKLRGL